MVGLLFATLWEIWLERNSGFLEGQRDLGRMFNTSLWVFVSRAFCNYSLGSLHLNWYLFLGSRGFLFVGLFPVCPLHCSIQMKAWFLFLKNVFF